MTNTSEITELNAEIHELISLIQKKLEAASLSKEDRGERYAILELAQRLEDFKDEIGYILL